MSFPLFFPLELTMRLLICLTVLLSTVAQAAVVTYDIDFSGTQLEPSGVIYDLDMVGTITLDADLPIEMSIISTDLNVTTSGIIANPGLWPVNLSSPIVFDNPSAMSWEDVAGELFLIAGQGSGSLFIQGPHPQNPDAWWRLSSDNGLLTNLVRTLEAGPGELRLEDSDNQQLLIGGSPVTGLLISSNTIPEPTGGLILLTLAGLVMRRKRRI